MSRGRRYEPQEPQGKLNVGKIVAIIIAIIVIVMIIFIMKKILTKGNETRKDSQFELLC